MKNIISLTIFIFAVTLFSQSAKAQTEAQRIELCTKVAGGATLLSSYPVQLPAAKDGERPPITRQAVAMRKGNAYRFTICTDEESTGEAILVVLDEGKQVGSSYNPETGRTFQNFDFECNKSAAYVIMISFKDGREGSAIAIVSHVKTL